MLVPARKLKSKEQRKKLPISKEPHWSIAGDDIHLGYYKGKLRTTWIARRRVKGKYVPTKLGITEDTDTEDGLSYGQALALISHPETKVAKSAFTVQDAINEYLAAFEGKSKADTASRLSDHPLASVRLDSLTATQIEKWHRGLVTQRIENWKETAKRSFIRDWRRETGKRTPTAAVLKQAEKYATPDDEVTRKARDTANRNLTPLKAALNRAFNHNMTTNTEFQKVKPFRKVDKARVRFLTPAEAAAFLDHLNSGALRDLCLASLKCGARLGELQTALVEHWNPAKGLIWLSGSKTETPRHVAVDAEGKALFSRLAKGKKKSDRLFLNTSGNPWGRNQQRYGVEKAWQRAGLEDRVQFRDLRTTYGSFLAHNGVPLQRIAKALGHKSIRTTEKYYAFLLEDDQHDIIRSNVPKLRKSAA